MSDTSITVTLTGEAARILERLISESGYADAQSAVADALSAFEPAPPLEPWQEELIGRRLRELDEHPDSALSIDEVRALVFGEKD